MSGRKRKEEDEAEVAASEDAPRNKKVALGASENSDDIVVCEISNNRRVSVRRWQGKIWVDIREFYSKDGNQRPGKKGISLSVDQWKMLRDHTNEIDKALADA